MSIVKTVIRALLFIKELLYAAFCFAGAAFSAHLFYSTVFLNEHATSLELAAELLLILVTGVMPITLYIRKKRKQHYDYK
jgi:hypothetical protein